MPAMTYKRACSVARIKRIEKALSERQMGIPDIAEATFSSIPVAQRFVTHLHQQRRIHISGWSLKMSTDRPFGYVSPLYSAGDAPDVVLELTGAK